MGASTGGVIAESAFIVDDDGLLSDLMNLDSLSEQVGDDIVESWMDGSSCSDFNLTTYSEISCNEEGNSDPLDFSPSSDHSGSDHGQQPPVSFPPPRSPSLVGSGNIAMLLSDPSLSTMAAVEPFLTVPESLLCKSPNTLRTLKCWEEHESHEFLLGGYIRRQQRGRR